MNAVAIRHQRPFRAATGGDDGSIVFHQGEQSLIILYATVVVNHFGLHIQVYPSSMTRYFRLGDKTILALNLL